MLGNGAGRRIGGDALIKSELEKLKSLKLEVKQLEEELRNLPFVPATVKGSMNTFPYIERTFKVLGVDEKKGRQVRERLDSKLNEIQNQILVMEAYLDTVDDPEMRTILRLKYRNGLTNQRIADELGYSKSAITMKFSRFFEGMKV